MLPKLNFTIEHLHIPLITENSETFLYIKGFFDTLFECNYYIFLNSFYSEIKFMRLVTKLRNIQSRDILINLKINYSKIKDKEILISDKRFSLPKIDEMKFFIIFEFFVDKKFKALLGLHLPMLKIV